MRISDDQVIEVDDKKNKNKNEINKEEVLKQIEDDKKKEENNNEQAENRGSEGQRKLQNRRSDRDNVDPA